MAIDYDYLKDFQGGRIPDLMGAIAQGLSLRGQASKQKREAEEAERQQQEHQRQEEYRRTMQGLTRLNDFTTPEGQQQLLQDMRALGFGPEAMGMQPKPVQPQFHFAEGADAITAINKADPRQTMSVPHTPKPPSGANPFAFGQDFSMMGDKRTGQVSPTGIKARPQPSLVVQDPSGSFILPRGSSTAQPITSGGKSLQGIPSAKFGAEQNLKKAKAFNMVQGSTQNLTDLETVLTRVKDSQRLSGVTYPYSRAPSVRPESQALEADIDGLQAKLATMALAQMREASATGGAVGQVTENEWKLLANSLAILDRKKQDPKAFKAEVARILFRIQLSKERIQKAFSMQFPDQGEDVDSFLEGYR